MVSQVQTSSIVQDQGTADSKFLSNKEAERALMLPQHDGIHDEYDDVLNKLLMPSKSIMMCLLSFYLLPVGFVFVVISFPRSC